MKTPNDKNNIQDMILLAYQVDWLDKEIRLRGAARCASRASLMQEALDIFMHLDQTALSSLRRRAACHGQCLWDLLNAALLELVAQPDDQYEGEVGAQTD